MAGALITLLGGGKARMQRDCKGPHLFKSLFGYLVLKFRSSLQLDALRLSLPLCDADLITEGRLGPWSQNSELHLFLPCPGPESEGTLNGFVSGLGAGFPRGPDANPFRQWSQ